MTQVQDNRFLSKKEKEERRRKYLRNSLTDGISQQLFQYKTLHARLSSETKSLDVTIMQDKILSEGKPLNSEWFFEMESLLNWLNEHLEVKTVKFNFDSTRTSFPYQQFKNLSQKDVTLFSQRLRKINLHILELPQTSLIDMNEGLTGLWLEMAMSFDIRVSRPGARLYWDQLKWGHYPASGSLALLQIEGLEQKSRSWFMTCSKLLAHEAYSVGLIDYLIYDEQEITKLKHDINKASSIARIQLKKGLLEKKKHELNKTALHDLACLNGTLESGDWIKALVAYENEEAAAFHNPQSVKIELSKKGMM